MKNKNQRIWSDDRELLINLADEQENYIGRHYKLDLDNGLLIIYALPKWHKKNRPKEKKVRNKRAESAARRQ